MHASYQIIIQVLQLAYTTQACILNLKAYAMQASTWLCTFQMQLIKVHELAPPTCVLLLSKNFIDSSLFFNVAPSLSMSMSNLYFFVSIFPKDFISSQSLPQSFHNLSQSKAFIYLYNLSPFVINFHKRCASYWCKGMHFGVDGWDLNFWWTSLDCWNDTTCRYLLGTLERGTPSKHRKGR